MWTREGLLLGHDVLGIVIRPAAVIGEVVAGLNKERAVQQVSNDGGDLEGECVSCGESYGRGSGNIAA